MVIRILFLLLALVVLVNLCLVTACYITRENLYQKYGKEIMKVVGGFVFLVAVLYTVLALVALK